MKTFLTFLILFICSIIKSQIKDAKIAYEQSNNLEGCFFIAPYKVNATSPKTALLNKAMILNSNGEVIYYRHVPIGNDFKIQSNGVITLWDGKKWLILNNKLNIVDSVSCVNGIETDSHDFIVLANGHYLLIGKMLEIVDLSTKAYFNQRKQVIGSKRAKVKYDVIQELDENKNLVYQWNSKDHFKLEDADRFYLKDSAIVDVTHFNSIDEDEYGHFLISARFFNEVLKVNKSTGKIIWRMGGKYNNVVLLKGNQQPFLGQHDARFTGLNTFSLFDNGHTYDSLVKNARALEFEINDSLKTAKLIWSYSNTERIHSQAAGSLQRVKNKYTLINYGKISSNSKNITFEMLDANNKKILTLSYPDTMASYRAYFYSNCPVKMLQPNLRKLTSNKITTDKLYKYYKWSTGETSSEISTTKGKYYYVFVSNDGKVFVRSIKFKG